MSKYYSEIWIGPKEEVLSSNVSFVSEIESGLITEVTKKIPKAVYLWTNDIEISNKLEKMSQANSKGRYHDDIFGVWMDLFDISIPIKSNLKMYLNEITGQDVYYRKGTDSYTTNNAFK